MTNGETVHNSREKPDTHPGYCFLTNDQLREIQINEANLHQLAVDYGKCWEFYSTCDQTDLPTSTMFSSDIKFSSTNADASADLEWNNEQKSTFIELLGRWSATALPEIADHINKPLFECQIYLDMLKSYPRCIDSAEIPAAEEVPSEKTEFDIETEVDQENQLGSKFKVLASKSKGESCKLFNRPQMESQLGRPFQPADLAFWETVLKKKLKEWITEFMGQYKTAGGICKDQKEYLHKIFEKDRRIRSLRDQTLRFAENSGPLESLEDQNAGEVPINPATQPHNFLNKSVLTAADSQEGALSENDHANLVSIDKQAKDRSVEIFLNNTLETQSESYGRSYRRPELELFGPNDESDIEISLNALSDTDDLTDDLIDQEAEWLESLDQFNSMHSLLARGLPAHSISPPPPRSSELEKFMCQE